MEFSIPSMQLLYSAALDHSAALNVVGPQYPLVASRRSQPTTARIYLGEKTLHCR